MKKRLLENLFDYQRFAGNEKLARLIAETEDRNGGQALFDDDLEGVNAAGDNTGPKRKGLFPEDKSHGPDRTH
jgi:hypothetical protein